MNIKKWQKKLDNSFNPSKDDQEKKHEKLSKIIRKLEEKKLKLEKALIKERKVDDTSHRYHEISKELKIVAKFIKKAKKNRDTG